MTIHAIMLDNESVEAFDRVKSTWPGSHHIVDDRLALVRTDGTTLTSDVARNAGIGPDTGITGLVVQMGYYSGTASRRTVEWIEKHS